MTGTGMMVSTVGMSAVLLVLLRWLLQGRPKTSVKDKSVLITGASSGLGEACAHAFYKAGAKVILCARREVELQRVKADLINDTLAGNPHEPKIFLLDLADLTSIPDKVAEALKLLGNIDILINNGGISYRGVALETALEVHQKLMTVNYFGQVALTKAIVSSMIKSGGGHIVAVSSIQGKIAIPYRSAYAASKHAMQAFFDCLRAEVSHKNIHVSVLSPGYIRTKLSLNAVTGDGSAYGVMDSTTESGASPEHIAVCILHAVTHQQNEVLIAAFTHKLTVALRNILPSLFFWVMNFRAKKQRKQDKKST